MDTAKTDAVSIWPMPTNLKAVQAFLGFTNFYRRFIMGFSDIVIPLIHLTRKDTPFAWGPSIPKHSQPSRQPLHRHPSWCISTLITPLLLKLTLLTM